MFSILFFSFGILNLFLKNRCLQLRYWRHLLSEICNLHSFKICGDVCVSGKVCLLLEVPALEFRNICENGSVNE